MQAPLVIPASPELLREAEKIKTQLAALESDDQTAAAKVQTAASDDKEIERRIAKVKRAIDEEMSELTQEQKKLVDAESRLEHEKTGLLQVEVDVQKVQSQKPAVKTLRHKLTPVSRMIQGKELHYQLLNNRVAYLPIQELMEQMRQSLTDQRSRLYREGFLQGQVGPILGFRMDFIARVRRLSTIDELRQGSSVTVELSKWQLAPNRISTPKGLICPETGIGFSPLPARSRRRHHDYTLGVSGQFQDLPPAAGIRAPRKLYRRRASLAVGLSDYRFADRIVFIGTMNSKTMISD